MFSRFADSLRSALRESLPGAEAHALMAPLSASMAERMALMHKSDPRKGSVLILLYPDKGEIFILLILRAKYDGVHSGQVAFPGGKMEGTDKDLVETALRETEEEIGIPRGDVSVLGTLTELYIPASNFLVLPVVGTAPERPQFRLKKDEIETLIEVDLPGILNNPVTAKKTIRLADGRHREVPYYNISGHHVWGATAMMISELRAVLNKKA